MKAIVWTQYGSPDVLQLREVEKPTPKDDEILIRIEATTVTAGDCELRSLKFPIYLNLMMRLWRGFTKPRKNSILGTELAGEIVAVGKDVTKYKVGDQVFGSAGVDFGTNAEYICLPEEPGEMEGGVTIKPADMTFEETATVPFGGRDALHFLRKGNLQRGQIILINGAGGSIGTFAVQLAKHFGAEVTAVDRTEKLDMLHAIGADQVIDYTQEDFTKKDEVYDVIFDVVGVISLFRSNKALKRNGTYLLANPASQLMQGLRIHLISSRKVIMETANRTIEDLVFLRELIESGKIKAVIDRCYPLEKIAEAHRYVETGQKQGNVVITLDHNKK